ncbi:tRNA lysidine(34) synthetase TilS [Chlamydia sp. 17-3921]|uniref:tRNA lysidine(34) synthetase TilS n=1 Tax=Chlamydia sp. 17-3921 TaxID=2675798 RepID=UPI001F2E5DBD|nr:tRNA lysidine(34) synthetase TilS [Chlamydia sp. 17-3921]
MLASCSLKNDKRLEVFFSSLDMKKNYLLGLSGGSDSLFLFYLLKFFKVSFSVAHVDYGWRTSSFLEAEELQLLCQRESVPFFGRRFSSEKEISSIKDPENSARKFRYVFFYELCQQYNLEGIFLAHHADDQAETVLKRLLEGAHLSNLKGMAERSFFQGIQLLRPLLHVSKAYLVEALESAKVSYVRDETNNDERYLRARMRKKIFPWLEEVFGKNISSPLFALAEESKELAEYMELQGEPFLSKVIYENELQKLPLPKELIHQSFLAKWVCKKFFSFSGVSVSRHFLQTVYDHLYQGSSAVLRMRDKSVIVKPGLVMIQ